MHPTVLVADPIADSASLLACLYAVENVNWFLSRFSYLTPAKISKYIYGIALTLLVFEAGCRSMGWDMLTIGVGTILYALFWRQPMVYPI